MKPLPPCTSACTRRCAVPNCHDPAICGDWAAYQQEMDRWRADYQGANRERYALKDAKRRVRSMCRRKERDKR